MIKTIIGINGMMCGMCEAHINDAIRKAFSVKKVSASHGKGTAVVLSEEPLDESQLKHIIDETGYTFVSAQVGEPRKRFLGLF